LQQEEKEKEESSSDTEIDYDAIDTSSYTLASFDQNEEQFVSQTDARCAGNIKRAEKHVRTLGINMPPPPYVPNKPSKPVKKKRTSNAISPQRKSKRVRRVHDPTANQEAEQIEHEGGCIPRLSLWCSLYRHNC
jgi:hypothetical protein